MSASKVKMREKKMRNQPASVQYGSPGVGAESSGWSRRGDPQDAEKSRKTPSRSGWVRGHQREREEKSFYMKEMPKHINAGSFARARAAEVRAMLKAVTKTTGSSHVFQALPRHMRRRAMSHNIKRLPRRLRDVASRMREKSLQGASKKREVAKSKSRRARRRHGNLLLEFNRRQRKNIWLETHIWHAKRFHMVKRWGYCLGERPTLKCYRPCYRAMSGHCLLQDLSYYCCIELLGEEDKLLTALSQLTSKEAGPTFAAALSLSGRRQGSVMVYRAGGYPSRPLGPVTFLWRPRGDGSAGRQLWVWAHPTLKPDLLPELRAVCECCEAVLPPVQPEPETQTETTAGGKRKRGEGDLGGAPAKRILGDGTRPPGTPVTWRSSSTGITINDLTMEMVRFRLIGPQAHAVLTEALEAATECEEASSSSLWWPQLCSDREAMTLHQEQAAIFSLLKGVCSTAELCPGMVLGLSVDDPRLTLPTKKVKALPCVDQSPEAAEAGRRELVLRGAPERCSQSCLWDRSVRDNVTENKIPEQELNRMRRDVLVPGSRLSPTPLQGRVPVLLVHQPGKQVGSEMSGWGAGWDLLLPKGWGMAFWVPLVYRGVRVAGLHMSLKHSQNKGAPHFPHDFPDCPAGARFQEEQEAELLDKFKRRPPAKRNNFIKHGCLAPFRCPWQQLAEEWERKGRWTEERKDGEGAGTPKEEEEEEEQGKKASQQESSVTKPLSNFIIVRNRKCLRLLSSWCRPLPPTGQRWRGPVSLGSAPAPALDRPAMASLLTSHRLSLVWVRVTLPSKGRPELHAMLSAPTAADLLDSAEAGGPQEPLHADPFKDKVKLKRLQKSGAPAPSDPQEPVLGLWPDPLPDISSHCSRVTLGWVTQGDFCLSSGRGTALGLVSVAGLLHTLLEQPEGRRGAVLLRNPNSLHYRLAQVSVEA